MSNLEATVLVVGYGRCSTTSNRTDVGMAVSPEFRLQPAGHLPADLVRSLQAEATEIAEPVFFADPVFPEADSDDGLIAQVRQPVGHIEVHVTFETTLGLLAAFFIGFFAPVVFGVLTLIGFLQGRMNLAASTLPLMLATGWLAGLIARMAAEASMGRLYDAVEDAPPVDPRLPKTRLPFALAMAARMPSFNWYWRPWIGIWWISHFCIAAVIGHLVAVGLIRELDVATVVIAVPLAVLVHFAFLFASNLYLVLASRAFVRSPRFCVRVWKRRYLIDLIIALLMLARGLN